MGQPGLVEGFPARCREVELDPMVVWFYEHSAEGV